jgi:tyrosine phenol-lyase
MRLSVGGATDPVDVNVCISMRVAGLLAIYKNTVKTIIEPFRIKSVEPLRHTTVSERERLLEDAGYNLFLLPAREILLDLLTDSGTSAMSNEQWAALMRGDESYAGSDSFYRLKEVVQDLTRFRHVIPTHQGRAAERILFAIMCRPGATVPNNTHFDTTRANIEYYGAHAVDLPVAVDTQTCLPFKGNLDLEALECLVKVEGAGLNGKHGASANNCIASRYPALSGCLPLR